MFNLGVDLGGTTIKVGLVAENGTIAARAACSTCPERGAAEIIREIAGICQTLCDSQAVPLSDINSIGFGTPGFIDRARAAVIYSANLGFHDVRIGEELSAFFPQIPVYVENDANCAAIAESESGAARAYASSVTITLGTGVGAGVIIEKKVFVGYSNLAPEIGHLVIEPDGEPCPCGRSGIFLRRA